LVNPINTLTKENQISVSDLVQIKIELLNQVFKQFPIFLLGSIIITAAISAFTWDKISLIIAISWLVINLTTTLISYFCISKYKNIAITTDNVTYLRSMINVFALIHGMLWGAVPILVIKLNHSDYNLILTFALLIILTQISLISALNKISFFLATTPILASLILFNIFFNYETLHFFTAILTLLYFGVCFLFYKNSHNTLVESFGYKYKKSNQNAQQNNQDKNITKSRFLAAASHDLRQPIHAQTLLIEELIERIDDPALMNLIRDIKISTNALHELFDAIMDISRLDNDKVIPKIDVFPLRELLDTIALEFKELANDRQLRFEIIAPNVNVKSDRGLLMRIIQNLVSNAIKYTQKGSVIITTRIRGNFIRIEVRDSGIGIADDQKNAIFQEFYQIPNRGIVASKSLGIGLSIVHRLSTLLNHELEVISKLGRGSTFILMVPLIKTESKANTSRLRVACNIETFNGNRVLIIDDDVLILRSMSSLLTHWGCNVTAVTSGKEACTIILPETPKPDIIIADYKLQDGETGIDAIKMIKRMLNIAVPTLIVTGDTSEATISQIKSNGYTHLNKPIAPAKLRSYMRYIFDENTINN